MAADKIHLFALNDIEYDDDDDDDDDGGDDDVGGDDDDDGGDGDYAGSTTMKSIMPTH